MPCVSSILTSGRNMRNSALTNAGGGVFVAACEMGFMCELYLDVGKNTTYISPAWEIFTREWLK